MDIRKKIFIVRQSKGIGLAAAGFIVFMAAAAQAGTFRLDNSGQLRPIDSNDKFTMAAANIKKLGQEGKTRELKKALADLKVKFPSIAGADYDAFVKAELLFGKGKFEKAYFEYEKLLNKFPQSRFYQAAIDREYSIGTAYIQGRKKRVLGIFRISGFEEGTKVMEKVSDRTGDSLIAVNALVAIAEAYEKTKSFEEAYQEWSIISDRWPGGTIAKDALLGMARCQHAAYRGPKYDSSSLLSAKGYYNRFKLMYSEDAKVLNIDQRLKLIEEQIAYKKFTIGKYYERTESRKGEAGQVEPSILYFDMVTATWPGSEAAKLAKAEEQKENVRGGK
jgi:outer membrane protein assembly factor BamD